MNSSSNKSDNQASIRNDPVALVVHRRTESFERGILDMWTVYAYPRDYPDKHVARRFLARGPQPTDDLIGAGNLEDLRAVFIKAGLTRLPRSKMDEPQIVETWV